MISYPIDIYVEPEVKSLYGDDGHPTYAKDGDSGCDVRCKEAFKIYPGETRIIKTGVYVNIGQTGLEIQVRPRSGMSAKTKLRVANAPGTIDSKYTDEIGVIMDNTGDEPLSFDKGERIAQLVLCPVFKMNFKVVSDRETLGKGREGGFGSTGTK